MVRAQKTRFARIILCHRSWLIGSFQGLLILASLVLAWLLRFNFLLPDRGLLLSAAPILIAIRLAAFARCGLLQGWWRYTDINDAVAITKAIAIGSVVVCFLHAVGSWNHGVPPRHLRSGAITQHVASRRRSSVFQDPRGIPSAEIRTAYRRHPDRRRGRGGEDPAGNRAPRKQLPRNLSVSTMTPQRPARKSTGFPSLAGSMSCPSLPPDMRSRKF